MTINGIPAGHQGAATASLLVLSAASGRLQKQGTDEARPAGGDPFTWDVTANRCSAAGAARDAAFFKAGGGRMSEKMSDRETTAHGNLRAWTPEEDAVLSKMREQGKSLRAIAQRLGRTANAVELRNAKLIRKGVARQGFKASRVQDAEANFWAGVDRSRGPHVCWPWTRARYGEGRYGACGYDLGDGKKTHGTHRLAFILSGGELSEDRPHVIHSCDNKICCNPAHLSAGSHADNIQQAHNRGLMKCRPKTGSQSAFAKLSEADVQNIRGRLARGAIRRDLAAEYGLSKSGMDHIAANRTWRHV